MPGWTSIVAEAQAFIADLRGALGARTIAWLDQRSAELAADTSTPVLVEAWNQQKHTGDAAQWHHKDQYGNGDSRQGAGLGPLE
jgi:hypothetical protein